MSRKYRDSYFTNMASYANAIKYLDGILIKAVRGCSFYGLINKRVLEGIAKRHELVIKRSWIHEKSAFVLVAGRVS